MLKATIFLTTLFLLAVVPLYALDMDGLVLYLPFDEGNGEVAADASGTGNDGKLEGNVEWVDGKYGKAVHVSDDAGDNMVVVADHDTLDVTDQMTMAVWAYIETMPDQHCSLITKADTYMIHTSLWSGKGMPEMEPLLWPFNAWQTTASVAIPFNEWHHVLGTFDGKEIKTYIDGELQGQVAYGDKIAVTDADLVIGRDSRGCCNTRKASQILDEVMLWNRAVDDGEVREIMAGVASPVQAQGLLTVSWGAVKSRF